MGNRMKQNTTGNLHLVLTLYLHYPDEKEQELLHRYGKVRNTVSRDILVPGEMTLHALHYCIQILFGFQNSHLHSFRLPGQVFNTMTGGSGGPEHDGLFLNWLNLVGIYFRFPGENLEDRYWDDDYDGSKTPRAWFRSKYRGPYSQLGSIGEDYPDARENVQGFENSNPLILRSPSFSQRQTMSEEQREAYRVPVPLKEVQIREIESMFADGFTELIERLPLAQLLFPAEKKAPSDLEKRVRELAAKIHAAAEHRHVVAPAVLPVTDTLLYSYDYGDGWTILIQCKDICSREDAVSLPGVLPEDIEQVAEKMRPVCIASDGLPVMDDIGGDMGYLHFLETVFDRSSGKYDGREAADLLAFAHRAGWTGQMKDPRKIL